jgi:site-specific recombinase XerD
MSTDITIYQGDGSQAIAPYTPPGDYILSLNGCILAWLNTKEGRSESLKTRRAYEDTITAFRAWLASKGLDLDSTDTHAIALCAEVYAGANRVSPATFNQRLAILSSFYAYALKQEVCTHNPIGRIDRRKAEAKDAALPMSNTEIAQAFAAIDRSSLEGLRDYALLSLAVTTGRRSRELASLVWADIRITSKKMLITWRRTKGNKQMRDEIEPRTQAALLAYLHALHGADLGQLASDTPVFVSLSRNNYKGALSLQAMSDICLKRLGTSKVHTTRHTFAVNSEKAGGVLIRDWRQARPC